MLQFKQSNFLKPCVEINTRLRQELDISEIRNKFFHVFSGFLCRENYGESETQDTINYGNSKLSFTATSSISTVQKPFKGGMVAVTMLKKSILWNKPIYLGAAIIDVSKLQIHKFECPKILLIYGKKARVMY